MDRNVLDKVCGMRIGFRPRWAMSLFVAGLVVSAMAAAPFHGTREVVIHEIAWMGTTQSANQQWLELYNTTDEVIDLDGWQLRCRNRTFEIPLQGEILPHRSVVLIQEAHPELPGVPIHMTFSYRLNPEGERLILEDARGRVVDLVDRWYAGDAETAATMQRLYPYRAGYRGRSWTTSTIRYDVGYGSPGFRDNTRQTRQALHAVYHGPEAINVYFNQPALTEYAKPGNLANHRVDMEERFLHRIHQATNRIDITLYELNLPNLANALLEKAAEGVLVRVVADSKAPSLDDPERVERWEVARMHLERLKRGADGVIGTDDDVRVFANVPIFAFEGDRARRVAMGLPPTADDIEEQEVPMGATKRTGRLLTEGERRDDGSFYRPGAQMHNKFIIIDDRWVWTASMNFTVTDLYGSEWAMARGLLRGNSNNGLEIHSPEVAAIYRAEFEQMWGDSGAVPNPDRARFSGRKSVEDTPNRVTVGGRKIDILFSPGYDVITTITDLVRNEAKEKVYFSIFAWSDYELERVMKIKWEGDDGHQQGELTGFQIRGLTQFWEDWWSAAINMTGRTPDQTSDINPNIHWNHRPPVYRPNDVRRLHHKYMLIDPDTEHNPVVITGSANWSNNANRINDENTLFIFCGRIANQYVQDFYGSFSRAGGTLPPPPEHASTP